MKSDVSKSTENTPSLLSKGKSFNFPLKIIVLFSTFPSSKLWSSQSTNELSIIVTGRKCETLDISPSVTWVCKSR